jgi:hypothetical protein
VCRDNGQHPNVSDNRFGHTHNCLILSNNEIGNDSLADETDDPDQGTACNDDAHQNDG